MSSPSHGNYISPLTVSNGLNEMDELLSNFTPANPNGEGLLKIVLAKFKHYHTAFQDYEKCDADLADEMFPADAIFEMEISLFSDMKKWVEILPNIRPEHPEGHFIIEKTVADMKKMLDEFNNQQ